MIYALVSDELFFRQINYMSGTLIYTQNVVKPCNAPTRAKDFCVSFVFHRIVKTPRKRILKSNLENWTKENRIPSQYCDKDRQEKR